MDSTPDADLEAELGSAQLRAWQALLETSALLRHRLDSVLLAESGLSGSDYPVLSVLARAGDRDLRSSELAEAIGWERSRLSHQLTRMERRGLVRRTGGEDPDSRHTGVQLTDEGREALRGATGVHARAVRAHFADVLSEEQVRALADIMATLAAHLARTPAPAPRRGPVG